ncbi:hypothetical protein Tco_1323429 [Tanacetum coccineum]
MCCDDAYPVTPHVFALAGCDRLVSEPLVIENLLVMSSPAPKRFRWEIIYPPPGPKVYRDPVQRIENKAKMSNGTVNRPRGTTQVVTRGKLIIELQVRGTVAGQSVKYEVWDPDAIMRKSGGCG